MPQWYCNQIVIISSVFTHHVFSKWVHSPPLLCSSQRRTGPCSGRCSTAGRLFCGKVLLVGPLRAISKTPRTGGKLGLFPASLWLETSTAASVCAQPETAACLHLFYKSLKSTGPKKWQTPLSTPQHTWPTFSTPAPRGQHQWEKAAARNAEFNLVSETRFGKLKLPHMCIKLTHLVTIFRTDRKMTSTRTPHNTCPSC